MKKRGVGVVSECNMSNKPVAKKRKGDLKEDIANLQFGEDFAMPSANVEALLNAEVKVCMRARSGSRWGRTGWERARGQCMTAVHLPDPWWPGPVHAPMHVHRATHVQS
jgi:hypothetical protein